MSSTWRIAAPLHAHAPPGSITGPNDDGAHDMHFQRALATCALTFAAALAPAISIAQDNQGWRWSGSLNLFLPTLSGTSTFPASVGGSAPSVDTSKLLDSLNSVFMATLEARNGRWGLFTDVIYMDLSADRGGSRDFSLGGSDLPVGASANLNYGLKGWSWTLGGTYAVAAGPLQTVDLIAGARLLDIQSHLDWSTAGNIGSIAVADRSGTRDTRLRNWDAIIGAKGRYVLPGSGKWFLPWYLDVGTGNSQMTTQAMGGVGYAFPWGDVVGAWRYLGYDFKSNEGLQDLRFSGPMVSAVFHW
jgi:hypothetical protein